MIQSFPERTHERIARLGLYSRAHVLDQEFVCRHYVDCRQSRSDHLFFEGQLPHVGRHYDLEVDGRPTRIMVVGQEYGHGPGRVSLSARTEMVAWSAAQDFRSRARNPHMKGTASILRLLLGREPGVDSEGEKLPVSPEAHIFDGFALVNALLCSAVREARPAGENFRGAAKGFSSSIMRRNCGEHLAASLEVLEPTVIVIQGQGVRKWIAPVLGIKAVGTMAERAKIGGNNTDVLTFDHPSAGGASGYWGGSPRSRYLLDVVAPAIHGYLRALQGQSQP